MLKEYWNDVKKNFWNKIIYYFETMWLFWGIILIAFVLCIKYF